MSSSYQKPSNPSTSLSGKTDYPTNRDHLRRLQICKVLNSLIDKGYLPNPNGRGLASRVALHFGVSRQRVSQLMQQELKKRGMNFRWCASCHNYAMEDQGPTQVSEWGGTESQAGNISTNTFIPEDAELYHTWKCIYIDGEGKPCGSVIKRKEDGSHTVDLRYRVNRKVESQGALGLE